jgi:hypothetical protein
MCGKTFPRTCKHFETRTKSADGLTPMCRKCARARSKWLKENAGRHWVKVHAENVKKVREEANRESNYFIDRVFSCSELQHMSPERLSKSIDLITSGTASVAQNRGAPQSKEKFHVQWYDDNHGDRPRP